MTALPVVAAVTVAGGLALATVGWLQGIHRRQLTLAEILEMEEGERHVPVEAVSESPESPAIGGLTARAGELMGRLDKRGALTRALQAAEIPVKAGEYLFLTSVAVAVMGSLAGLLKGPIAGVVGAALVALVAKAYPGVKSRKRVATMRAQLPNAFSLIASSVSSGHTFLRSIQLLGSQVPKPLSGELQRVIAEVTLGSNLIDALEHMARRVPIDELTWAVKAVRIQQTTGGQLGEILHTLADFMRAREDVQREVQVLAAEGKFSGYVLLGLPVVVFVAMLVMSPGYFDPMLHGTGLLLLGVAGVMMALGYAVIRKMVRIDV